MFNQGDNRVFLFIYVDDIVIMGSNQQLLQDFINQMATKFSLRELRELKYFLGIQVNMFQKDLHLTQQQYLSNFLKKL